MNRRATVLLFLGALWILSGSVNAENMKSGVAVYTSMDHGRDEIAIALPFIKAERHALLVNVTTREGNAVRITNNQLKKLLFPTDLSKATVVDKVGIRRLRDEAEDIRSVQARYPRTANTLEPIVGGFERTIQVIESGNVLVRGRLIPKADYERQVAAARGAAIDITLGGRTYTGAKLSSINGDKVSIMHSGGAASISVDELSDVQIERLNDTSTSLSIERKVTVATTPLPSSRVEKSVPEAKMVSSQPNQLTSTRKSQRGEGTLELPSGERIRIPSTETLSNLSDAEYEAGFRLSAEAKAEIEKELDKIEAEYSKNPLYGRWRATDYPFFTVTISSDAMRFHKGLTPPFDEWVVAGTYSRESEDELLFRGPRDPQATLVRFTGEELEIAEFANSVLGIQVRGGMKIPPPVRFTFDSNRAGEGRTDVLLQDLKKKQLAQSQDDFPISISAWKYELGKVKIHEDRTSGGYRVVAVDGFGNRSYLEYTFSYPISLLGQVQLQATGTLDLESRKQDRETKLPEGMSLKCKILASRLSAAAEPFEIKPSAIQSDENGHSKFFVSRQEEQLLEADQLFYGISKLVEWSEVARENGISDLDREVPIEWPDGWVERFRKKRESLPGYSIVCDEQEDEFYLEVRKDFKSERLFSFRDSVRWAVLLANLEQFNLRAQRHYEDRMQVISGNRSRVETEKEEDRRREAIEKEKKEQSLNDLFK